MNDCWIDVWSIRFDRQIIDRIRCCPTLGSILFAQYLFYCLVWGILILSDYLIPSWFPINLYTNSIPILIQFRLSRVLFNSCLFRSNWMLFCSSLIFYFYLQESTETVQKMLQRIMILAQFEAILYSLLTQIAFLIPDSLILFGLIWNWREIISDFCFTLLQVR